MFGLHAALICSTFAGAITQANAENEEFDRDQVLVICALMGYRLGVDTLVDTFRANLALKAMPMRPAI